MNIKLLATLVLLFLHLATFAKCLVNRGEIVLEINFIDHVNEKILDQVTVTVLGQSDTIATGRSDEVGFISISLPLGEMYNLHFSKKGFHNKWIVLSNALVPAESNYKCKFRIRFQRNASESRTEPDGYVLYNWVNDEFQTSKSKNLPTNYHKICLDTVQYEDGEYYRTLSKGECKRRIKEGKSINNASLLWKASKDNSKPLYLYGTMHSRDSRVFNISDSAKARFYDSDILVTEMILDSTDIMKGFYHSLIQDTSWALSNVLGDSIYKEINEYLKVHSGALMAELSNRMTPQAISSLIFETRVRKEEPHSLDDYFQNEAGKMNKRIVALESYEEQMKLLNEQPLGEQVNMLTDYFVNLHEKDVLYEKLINAYSVQDVDKVYSLYLAQAYSQNFESNLVTKRNVKMVQQIINHSKEGSCFVTVGLLHLLGQDGLITLLRKKGFVVHPIVSI